MRTCAHCKKELDPKLEVFRSTSCPHCRADLRTCSNCVFYSPGSHWDCRETISEAVRDKEKANFCDFFRFKELSTPGATRRDDGRVKNDVNKLFGNG